MPEHQHTVFIAYARSDGPAVHTIAERLRSRGIETRVDIEDLPIGVDWASTLKEFIRNADTILFVITPAAMKSQWCLTEVEFAVRFNKRILPVLLKPVPEDVIPLGLARLQYLIFTDINDERAFNTLVDAIHAGAKYGHGAQGNHVFLSYRRAENAHVAGRIYDHLEIKFGRDNVFFDVERIPIGGDFRHHIRADLIKSQALVVVIGQRWAARFGQSTGWFPWRAARTIDYVRVEIGACPRTQRTHHPPSCGRRQHAQRAPDAREDRSNLLFSRCSDTRGTRFPHRHGKGIRRNQ